MTVVVLSKCMKTAIWLMGGKVKVLGEIKDPQKKHLIVSNHLSYIDILVVSSVFPTCYVTSVELKETPFLGQCAMAANSLFVERRARMNLRSEIQELAEALKNGLNVTVFPEATSTNGEGVLRFRRPLYEAAIQSGVDVLPICLNYRKIKGEAVTRKNRDSIFWYGDMPFANHFWGIFETLRSFEVEISILDPVSVEEKDARKLCELTYSMVNEKYTPCV